MQVAGYCGCLEWVWSVVVGGQEWESVCLRSVVLSAALRWWPYPSLEPGGRARFCPMTRGARAGLVVP
jgi:hypothetical protein